MPDPIDIILTINATQIVEQTQQLIQSASTGIGEAYSQACDKASAKLDEVSRKLELQKAVIVQNGEAIAALQAKKTTASEAELKNLDQEIMKLTKLTEQRQLDILSLEALKAKIVEKSVAASNADESEKLAQRFITDGRLADLKAMSDQIKAHNAIRDATASVAAQQAADNEKAATAAKKLADQQAASDEKETAANQKLVDQKMQQLQKQTAQQEADAAKQAEAIDKVVRKQREISAAMDITLADIRKLEAAKEAASGADAKRIEKQIENLKKEYGLLGDQLSLYAAKRVQLEEVAAIASATSEKEIADIVKTNEALESERLATDALSRSLRNVAVAEEEASNGMSPFLSSAGGMIGITSVAGAISVAFQSVEQKIQALRDEIDRTVSATDKLLDKQTDTFAASQQAFAELGITDPSQKQKALESLNDTIPSAQNLTPGVVIRTAEGMGAALKAAGINDPTSARFQDIVGNASQAVYQGMDPSLVKNVFTDMVKANPDVTGSQLNTQLSTLSSIAGSPSQANELMSIVQEQRRRYGVLGLGTQDVEKMFVSAGQHGIAPEERGSSIQGLLQGLDRFVGKTPEQYLSLYEEMTGVKKEPGQEQLLSTMGKHMSPGEMLQKEMTMRHMQDFPELNALFQAGVNGKPVDMRGVSSALAGMDPHRLEDAITAGGGPRAMASAYSVGNWQGATLPTGSAFPISSTPQEIAASQSAVATFQSNNREPVSPEQAVFDAQLKVEQDILDKHPELLPDYVRTYNEDSAAGKIIDKARYPGGIPSNKEVASSNIYARQFIQDALKQKAMYAQGSKATQADKDAMMTRLSMESAFLTSDGVNGSIPDAVNNKDYSSLPDPNNEAAVREWMKQNVDYQQNTNGIMTGATWLNKDFTGVPHINPVMNPLPPAPQGPPSPRAPTSQPVSINYHTRNVIYGYSPDALGSVNTPSNNYG